MDWEWDEDWPGGHDGQCTRLKIADDHKNEDNIKNEDDLKNEYKLKNKDNLMGCVQVLYKQVFSDSGNSLAPLLGC